MENKGEAGGIESYLKKLPNHKLYVTGHSLGAAMAVVAGMSNKFDKVVTFGEPRVGGVLIYSEIIIMLAIYGL